MKVDSTVAGSESYRVLFLPKNRGDAATAQRLFAAEELEVLGCADIASLAHGLSEGAGALLVAEERLLEDDRSQLAKQLQRQPAWSDIPVVVITRRGHQSKASRDLARLGNVTFVERPVRIPALVSVLRSALQARRRQYEVARALRNRDRFLAMIGHELRNPLATARLALELFDRGESDRGRTILGRQIDSLTHIVDDLLDVGRIVRGEVSLRKEKLDLRRIVEDAQYANEAKATDAGLELVVDISSNPVDVIGDATRLEQLVANLIDNAIKYTDRGGRVSLELGADDNDAVLTISDTGRGIPPRELDAIFDMFVRLDDRADRGAGGLGVGLHLAREIARLHDGVLEAWSAGPGRGSTFTLRLPLPDEADDAPRKRHITPRMQALRRLLVVDDVADLRELLGDLLRTRGFEVTLAENGAQALALLQDRSFDAALIDIGLPDIDGHQVAMKVRERGCSTRLIAMSGYGQDADRERSRVAGFDLHLTKPVDLDMLVQVLGIPGPPQND